MNQNLKTQNLNSAKRVQTLQTAFDKQYKNTDKSIKN